MLKSGGMAKGNKQGLGSGRMARKALRQLCFHRDSASWPLSWLQECRRLSYDYRHAALRAAKHLKTKCTAERGSWVSSKTIRFRLLKKALFTKTAFKYHRRNSIASMVAVRRRRGSNYDTWGKHYSRAATPYNTRNRP